MIEKRKTPWIRKGIVGDYVNHLTPEQITLMDDKWKRKGKEYGIENMWD